ncbi:hypothetical protein B5S28_g3937 [[Candida] boidinii]|nr:hypothetical protein B5S28_g3937 [[Candida] boidinii]GME94351.1 unnamed protein product [[Candida] boidinii]
MSNIQNISIPTPSGNEDFSALQNVQLQQQYQQGPQQPKTGSAEYYFNKTSEYMSEHPVITGVGIFAFAYVAAGIYQKFAPGAGAKGFAKGGFGAKMSAKEALEILDLKEVNLSKTKLKENHRRIMLLNHPDKGGSPFLATKINEAKDFLEKRGGLKK